MGFLSGQMAQAGLITQLAGAGSSMMGSYYSAKNQAANLNFQANIAGINARIAESAAQSELQKGQRQIGALTLQAGQLKARQRATLAANGVDLGYGSAAEIQASTDLMKEIDMDTIQANAVRSAWGYRTEKANYQAQAIMAGAAAKGIRPVESAVSSLLGGAGSVANSWYGLKKSGAFNPSDVGAANKTADPIYSLGASRKWW